MSKDYMNYISAIRTYREVNNMSQKQLGKKVGISPGLVSQIELGKYIPGPKTKNKLDGVLIAKPIVAVEQAKPHKMSFNQETQQFEIVYKFQEKDHTIHRIYHVNYRREDKIHNLFLDMVTVKVNKAA